MLSCQIRGMQAYVKPCGHVAYQIKGNEVYNSMLENTLLFPWDGGQKVNLFSFQKVVMLHIKLIGMKHRRPCKQIFRPFRHLQHLYGVTRSNFFSEEGYVAYHIMQLKCLTLCTPLTFWVGKKGQILKLCR